MLYRSTDCRCRRGAPVLNLAHSASFHSREKTAPSNPGIKHLDHRLLYKVLATQTGAEVEVDFAADGLRVFVRMPLPFS